MISDADKSIHPDNDRSPAPSASRHPAMNAQRAPADTDPLTSVISAVLEARCNLIRTGKAAVQAALRMAAKLESLRMNPFNSWFVQ